jgi:hypothetical protein
MINVIRKKSPEVNQMVPSLSKPPPIPIMRPPPVLGERRMRIRAVGIYIRAIFHHAVNTFSDLFFTHDMRPMRKKIGERKIKTFETP